MTIKKLTKEQAIIITGYTGILACNFGDFHKDVEKQLGHPVWTHQFRNKDFAKKLKELYRDNFKALIEEQTNDI